MSGSAGNSGDYDHLNGYVTFAAGQDSVEVFVRSKDDTVVELDETVMLKLETDGNLYTLEEARRSATLTIADNDIAPTVWIETIENAVEGVQDGCFVLKRSDTTSALEVRYTVGGSASNSTDYQSLSGYVTFAAGSDTAVIVVRPKDDLVVESRKNVILTLSSPTVQSNVAQYVLDETRNSGTLWIDDNDLAPTVWIESSENATEGVSNGKFVLMRSDASTALTVRYTLSGKARNNEDYEHLNGYVTFAAGQMTVEIVIRIKDDIVFEGNEDVTLTLETNGNGYVLDETKRTASLTIVDNDESPVVWIDSFAHGAEGGQNAKIVLKRDSFANELTVHYTIDSSQSTATPGIDFTIDGLASYQYSGVVTFAAGQDTLEIPIAIVDDQVVEINETLSIRLADPTVTGGFAQYQLDPVRREVSLLIVDNDAAPKIWIDSTQDGAESGGNGYFRLRRDNTDNAVTVSYTLSGSAENGNDYSRLSGNVTFAAGVEFVDIPVIVADDTIVEIDEVVTLQLTPSKVNNVNQYELEGTTSHPLSASIVIEDNDTAPLVWIDSVQSGGEGAGNGSFRLRRDNTQNPVTVYYSIGGSASNGSDYTSIAANATFAAGQNYVDIPINIVDDIVVELDETVTITLQPRQVNYVDQYRLSQSNDYPFAATIDIADNDTAPNVWIDSVRDGAEGGENGFFRLRRDNTQNPLTVYYTIDGTAANGSDYNYISAGITFERGQEYVTIPIDIIDDIRVELDEIVSLTLVPHKIGAVDQYLLDGGEDRPFISRITIRDNDTAPNVWIASVQDGAEGGQDGFFRLQRDNTQNPLTVYYRIGGTASNGADYSYISTSVTFAAGQSTVDIPIRVNDDRQVELSETVIITLEPRLEDRADQYILDGSEERPSGATIHITDNDAAPAVWIDSTSNGAEGVSDGWFRLRRDDTSATLTVYFDVGGTAQNSSDYSYIYDSVTFAQGQEYVDIPVSVIDDTAVEATETVSITLREYKENGIDQYHLGEDQARPSTATIEIFDDETAPQVWIEQLQGGEEGGQNGFFRLMRDDTQNRLTVYLSIGGTASNGSDYSSINSSVTFEAGQNSIDIPINVIDDLTVEQNETVILTLNSYKIDGVDQYVLAGSVDRPSTGTIVIRDNDVVPNVWIQTVQDGEEGGQNGLFRIYRDNTDSTLTVNFTVGGTASAGSDYSYLGSSVTLAAGQSYVDLPVTVMDDAIVEPEETVTITLQPRKVGEIDQYKLAEGSDRPDSATLVIVDNDIAPQVWFEHVRDGIEGSQNGLVRIYRDNNVGILTVRFSVGGTATAGQDYTAITANVTFQNGQSCVEIPINVIDDAVSEPGETVVLTLTPQQVDGVDQYIVPETPDRPAATTVVIHDNDILQDVWIETVRDAVEGGLDGLFRIYRENSLGILTVYFSIGGTAKNGEDYTRTNTSATFQIGQTFIEIPVSALDDAIAEVDETVTISLQPNKVNGNDQYLVADTPQRPGSATLLIRDNDTTQRIWIETGRDGVEGGQNGFFRVHRENPWGQMVVYYNVAGTAGNGQDYVSLPGNILFEDGQEYVDIPVNVLDDERVEFSETVTVTLTPKTIDGVQQYILPGTSAQPSSATVSIVDNDTAPNVWIDSVHHGAETEGGQNGWFRLMRDNVQNAVTVHYTISGTAKNGTDYGTIASSVVFAAGQDYVDIPIAVIDDNIVEILETVTITIQPNKYNNIDQYVVTGTTEKPASGTMTITDNDIAPNVWIDEVRNGVEGGQNGYFRLRRDNTFNDVTVQFTIGGTASNGTDYASISTTVTFARGRETVDVPIHLYDDIIVEGAETVVLTLQARKVDNVDQYILAATNERPSSATVTISDNDTAPTVWIDAVRSGQEGGQNGFFRIRRDNTQNPVTVDFTITGTATNGSDYSSISSSVTFVEGQDYIDIPINVSDDTIVEITETVSISLKAKQINGIDQYLLVGSAGKPSAAEITITDNDIAPNVWIVAMRDGFEGGANGNFRLYRDNTQNPVTIDYQVGGTAIPGTDYHAIAHSVTFQAGQEYVDIPIRVIDDKLVEYDETVTITLLSKKVDDIDQYLLPGEAGKPASASLVIHDNELVSCIWIEATQNAVEGTQNGSFRIWRDNTDSTFKFYLSVAGTAEIGVDYAALPETLTFEVGQEYIDIPIKVIDDSLHELTETVILTLLPPGTSAESPYNIGDSADRPASATVCIIDDETGTLVWIEAIRDGHEDGENGVFRIHRNHFDGELTVFYETDLRNLSDKFADWATAGMDFELLPGMLPGSTTGFITFMDGQEYIDISIDVFDDLLIEKIERVTLSLCCPAADVDPDRYYFIEQSHENAHILIHDNDVPVKVSFDEVQNGLEDGQDGWFRLKRDVFDSELTVRYRFDYSSTASLYGDFTFETGNDYTVTFAAGEQYAYIRIKVVDDSKIEGNKTVSIILLSEEYGPYAVDGGAKATLTIADNDVAPRIWVDSVQNGTEGVQDGYIRLRRDNTTNAVTVTFMVGDDSTATRGADYVIPGMKSTQRYATVTFAAGQEYVDIPITVLDDQSVEGTETVRIVLISSEKGEYVLDDNITADVLIEDDDLLTAVWIDSTQNAVEGGRDGYIRLRRDNMRDELTIWYEFDARNSHSSEECFTGWAKNGTDFAYHPEYEVDGRYFAKVTFAAGAEYVDIPFLTVEDTAVEGTEKILVSLRTSTDESVYLIDAARHSAEIVIEDNDVTPTVRIDSVRNATEGGQDGYIRLYRSDATYSLTVRYVLSGTAIPGVDYHSFEGSIRFAIGEEYIDIPIVAIDDQVAGAAKTVEIRLLSPDDPDAYLVDSGNDTASLSIFDGGTANRAPVKTGTNSFTFDAGTNTCEIDLSDVFSDPGDTLSYSIVAFELYSSITPSFDENQLIFVFKDGWSGTFKLTIRAMDGAGLYVDEEISVTVQASDFEVNAEHYSVAHGKSLNVDAESGVLGNDIGPDGVQLTATLVEGPAYGTLQFNADGSFSYEAQDGYVGQDRFTYRVLCDDRLSGPLEVIIDVTNSVPVPVVRPYSGYANTTLRVKATDGLLAGLTDIEGDRLETVLISFTDTDAGRLYLRKNGSFIFSPKKNFSGTVTFTYAVTDGLTTSEPVTVTLTIEKPKLILVDDVYSVAYGQTLRVDTVQGVLANDSSQANNKSLKLQTSSHKVSLAEQARHGTVEVNRNGSFVYIPSNGFVGEDTFVYRVTDRYGDTWEAKVTIIVAADKPIVSGKVLTVESGQTLELNDLASAVLADSFVPGTDAGAMAGLYQIVLKDDPAHGTVQFGDDGIFRYNSQNGYKGTDVVAYEVVDRDGNVVGENSLIFHVTPVVSSNSEQRTISAGYHLDPASDRFGEISVGGIGASMSVDTPFIPTEFGTYHASASASRQNGLVDGGAMNQENTVAVMTMSTTGVNTWLPTAQSNETTTVTIVSENYDNDDWYYSEIVTYSYVITSGEDIYWGGYSYILVSSFLDGIYSYSFNVSTSDAFSIRQTIIEQTDTSSFNLSTTCIGGTSNTISLTYFEDTGSSARIASDSRTFGTFADYMGLGGYTYATEGGSVRGTVTQNGLYNKGNSSAIIMVGAGSGWAATGVQSAWLTDNGSSTYNGGGNYKSVVQSESSYSEMSGIITENGSESHGLGMIVSGLLGTDGNWGFIGIGSSSQGSSASYTCNGSGIYWQGKTDPTDYWSVSGTQQAGMSTGHADSASGSWMLINQEWDMISGTANASAHDSNSYGYDGDGFYYRSGGAPGNDWSSSGTMTQSGDNSDGYSYHIDSLFMAGAWMTTGSGVSSGGNSSSSSYDGTGRYNSNFNQNGASYLMNGTTTQNGSDSESMSYSTQATLLADGTWSVTGGGHESGSWGEGSTYEGTGTFEMSPNDPKVVEGQYEGTAWHDGGNDGSSSWNADWNLLNGVWTRTSGSGDSGGSYSDNIGFEGTAETKEKYTENGISYTTTSDRTVDGHDKVHSGTSTNYKIENGGWVVTDGDGSGGGEHFLHTGGTSTGTYSYSNGNVQNGHKANGSVNGGEDDTNSSEWDEQYEWLDSDWVTTGTVSYHSFGDGHFSTEGTGTFWSNTPTSQSAGTITEDNSSRWSYDSKNKDSYENDIHTLLSGSSFSETHDKSGTHWNGGGTFSQSSWGNGVYTEISGETTIQLDVTNKYDGDESKKVVNGEWKLDTGSYTAYDTDYSYTTKNGTGTIQTGDKSSTVETDQWDKSDWTIDTSGKVEGTAVKEWKHTGDSTLKESGHSGYTVKDKVDSYTRVIPGGAVSGTVNRIKTISNDYDSKTVQEKKADNPDWVMTSGKITIDSFVDEGYGYEGNGSYSLNMDGVWLYGIVSESGSSTVSTEGARTVSEYDAAEKTWKDKEGEGAIRWVDKSQFDDNGGGSYFVWGGSGTINDRSAGYESESKTTLYLDSYDVNYYDSYSDYYSYDAKETTHSQGGTYTLTSSFSDDYSYESDVTIDIFGVYHDCSGTQGGKYKGGNREEFTLDDGSDLYDSYYYDNEDKWNGSYDYDLIIEDGTIADMIWEGNIWRLNSDKEHSEFSNNLKYSTSENDVPATGVVAGMTFNGTVTTSSDYDFSASGHMDVEYSNGKYETTGGGKKTLKSSSNYDFTGDEETYDFYDGTGTRSGSSNNSSSVDTTIDYTWDDDAESWHGTGSSTTDAEAGYTWSDHASGSWNDGTLSANFSIDGEGDYDDKLGVKWSYDSRNGGWKADSIEDGQGSGSDSWSNHYDASIDFDDRLSGAAYCDLDLNYSFDTYSGHWDTLSDNSTEESMTISYEIYNGAVLRLTDGKTTAKSDSETNWSDDASYYWSESTEEQLTGNGASGSGTTVIWREGLRTTESTVERSLTGEAKDEHHDKIVTTWGDRKNSDGGTSFEWSSDVTVKDKFTSNYDYSEERSNTVDVDETGASSYAAMDYSGGNQGNWKTKSHSKTTTTTEQNEDVTYSLDWTYTIDHTGRITGDSFSESFNGSGKYSVHVLSNADLDDERYTYTSSSWGTASGNDSKTDSQTETDRTDSDEYHFDASRSDRNNPLDISNHITLKTEGHEKVSGESWRSWWSNGISSSSSGETTTPLDDYTSLDESDEFTTDSPGFGGRKSIAGGVTAFSPDGGGGGAPVGSYNGVGTGSPASGTIADCAPEISIGFPSFYNSGGPNVEAIVAAATAPVQHPTAGTAYTGTTLEWWYYVGAGAVDGLYTGVKAVVNAATSTVTSIATVGCVEYKPMEITQKDLDYGYGYAEGCANVGVNAGLAAMTFGLGCAAAQGSRVAGAAVGTFDTLAGLNAGRDLIESSSDLLSGEITTENVAKFGTSLLTLVILRFKSCFTAGTQVVVGAEYDENDVFEQYVTTNIEDVAVGDWVYSYDTVTGKTTQRQVTDVFVRESDHINYLTIADENGNIQVLETTDGHPFWVVTDEPDLSRAAGAYVDENGIILYHENLDATEHGYWVEAKDLCEGDVFLGANGELSMLVSKERMQFAENIKVYNFTVDGDHDYFVIAQVDEYGQTCILVHNADYPRNSKGQFTSKAGGETADTIRGKTAHENYKNTLPSGYRFNTTIPGTRLRPDAIDDVNKVVRELKPDSKSGLRKGAQQLKKYLDALGPGWKGILDLYNP